MGGALSYISTSYLGCIYNPAAFSEVVTKAAAYLELRRKEFDTLAFSGSSGGAVAYPVGALLGCHLSHIRKADGNHHSYMLEGAVEGWTSDYPDQAPRYVIIDDFIASGRTMDRIVTAMKRLPAFTILYRGRCSKESIYTAKYGEMVDSRDLGAGPEGWGDE